MVNIQEEVQKLNKEVLKSIKQMQLNIQHQINLEHNIPINKICPHCSNSIFLDKHSQGYFCPKCGDIEDNTCLESKL